MTPSILWIAYAANVAILLPVTWSMLAGGGTSGVFEGKVPESEGLGLLVGSLWLSILLASIAGFAAPRSMAPILFVQIAYKATWLLAFVLPLARHSGWSAVPTGITITFALIVATYPLIVWLGLRS